MSFAEFCNKYGIPENEAPVLDRMLRANTRIPYGKANDGSLIITPKCEDRCLEIWRKYKIAQKKIQQQRKEEEQFLREEDRRIAEVARSMPITSTNGFEGYRITEYGGYVSGDEAIMLSDSWLSAGDFNKDMVNDKIKAIRAVAIDELKMAAAQIGCNAVVGLDFDYVTIDRQRKGLGEVIYNNTFIILTANGTAVTIKPM